MRIPPLLVVLVTALVPLALTAGGPDPVPIAFGDGACGRLDGGRRVACSGPNYEAFATTACVLGRTYLHPLAARTVEEAYAAVAEAHPDRTWQYGDLGWRGGGELAPHKTHQNGLDADFFVPVRDAAGRPARVPISVFNKFGYGVEFDARGRHGDLVIDWTALTDHLLALERVGARHGVRVKRVILAPELRRRLLEADPRARRFTGRFSRSQAWVRHDEHYHVDFELPGRYRRPLSCE